MGRINSIVYRLKLLIKAVILPATILLLSDQTYCQAVDARQTAKIPHPCLILKKSDLPALRAGIKNLPLLKQSADASREIANKAIQSGIRVPVPADPGGGYTHEQHKMNYISMYHAAMVYQLSGEKQYAVFVRDMLLKYASLYPTLGLHPERKGPGPGKIFWQGLNDAVWLVYTIQAYDGIFDFLSENQRSDIESQLFRNIVKFFTVEDSYSFNRVHNHGTWAVAGVGMTGMVLGDKKLTDMALYSTRLDGSGGFVKQIKDLFSPDGYYSEGPYYQRYAILPFILFAKALDNNRPELNIFQLKEGVLTKSVMSLIQLSNTDGRFYPLNDAMKEKSLDTPELVYATNITFGLTGNRELLDVISRLGQVMISADGMKAARMIKENQTLPFVRKTVLLRDGVDGKQGGLAILRSGEGANQSAAVFKFTTQGMGHGHFDRLSYIFYDHGNEVITDYGSARYLNIESKDGGRYLAENKSWACQTVAHNTVVADEKSQFGANVEESEKYHPELLFSDFENPSCQIIAASDSNSYSGITLQRTLTRIEINGREFLVDLFRVENQSKANYDLPFYYNGQIISTNFKYEKELSSKKAIGSRNGYEHLWLDAKAPSVNQTASITFMKDKYFYTLSILGDKQTDLLFTSLGANDPNFNLRQESGILVRQNQSSSHSFVTVLESHGDYDPGNEIVQNSAGSVKNLELVSAGNTCSLIRISLIDGTIVNMGIAHGPDPEKIHTIRAGSDNFSWKGNYRLLTDKKQ